MDIAPIKGLYWREVCEDCIKCNDKNYKKPYIAKPGIEYKFCSDECASEISK